MLTTIEELKNRQIVCVKNGTVLGYVSDIEFNTKTGMLESIVIFGRPRFFGIFGSRQDLVIPWSEITLIGGDTILVKENLNFPSVFGPVNEKIP